jgi:hypothetical protein
MTRVPLRPSPPTLLASRIVMPSAGRKTAPTHRERERERESERASEREREREKVRQMLH